MALHFTVNTGGFHGRRVERVSWGLRAVVIVMLLLVDIRTGAGIIKATHALQARYGFRAIFVGSVSLLI